MRWSYFLHKKYTFEGAFSFPLNICLSPLNATLCSTKRLNTKIPARKLLV